MKNFTKIITAILFFALIAFAACEKEFDNLVDRDIYQEFSPTSQRITINDAKNYFYHDFNVESSFILDEFSSYSGCASIVPMWDYYKEVELLQDSSNILIVPIEFPNDLNDLYLGAQLIFYSSSSCGISCEVMVYTPCEENEGYQILTNESYSGIIFTYNECLCESRVFGLHDGEILAIGTDDGGLFTTCDSDGEASYRGRFPSV